MGRFGVIDSDGISEKPDLNEESSVLTEPFLVRRVDVDVEAQNAEQKQRLASLDVFRGLSIAVMVLVDNAGGKWPAINHSPWNGVTLADLVMPFFLFIVGVALALTYKRIPSKGLAFRKAIFRAIKLFFLGVLLQGGYFHGVNDLDYGVDVNTVRLCGILQRIAFVYLIVTAFEIVLPRRSSSTSSSSPSFYEMFRKYTWHWLCAVSCVALYLGLLYGLYVPDWKFHPSNNWNVTLTVECGVRGSLGPACNAVGYVDRWILGTNHLDQRPVFVRTQACSVKSPDYGLPPKNAPLWCQAPFDPEGILSSVSAIGTCFIGLHYGHILVSVKTHKNRLVSFVIPAMLLLIVGYLLHLSGLRMNKCLYSLSYMCFTAGAAGGIFFLFYALVDVFGIRNPTILLEWMGENSLLIYTLAATDIVVDAVQGFYWKSPENNLVTYVREEIFYALIPSERWAMLIYVLLGILLWALVAGALKAKGIFWKL